MATLFNKIDETKDAPRSWAQSKIVLAHKKGSLEDPSNFRMLALTPCIGKMYHLIKADRLSNFMVSNGYIDPKLQKAFISGINGCIEHTENTNTHIK